MKATQAWEEHHKAGLTDEVTGRFFRPKPHFEELYDTQTDPHCIQNLINEPGHTERIARMRQALRKWQLQIHDSGLLPEEELYKRSAESGMMIYYLVRRRNLYNLPAYLDAADLALASDPKNIEQLGQFLDHPDAGVRYWGVVGCLSLGKQAEGRTEDILALSDDKSHVVRAMAAYHLFRIGQKEPALEELEALLTANTYASMRTLTVVGWMGQEALPLKAAVRHHKAIGTYTKRRKNKILKDFATWGQ
jgi:hypothetical protein